MEPLGGDFELSGHASTRTWGLLSLSVRCDDDDNESDTQRARSVPAGHLRIGP